jgi:LemA protein
MAATLVLREMVMKWIVLGFLGFLTLMVIIVLAISVGTYNGLVRQSQAVDSQWAQVQNVYQRRFDLIQNLVNTVAGAANFEKSTLVEVTDARASVGRVTIDQSHAPEDAAKLQEFQQAQGQLGTALSHLMVVSEQYPQLRATENFLQLQAQLEGTENRISVERGRFNDVTQSYDTAIHSFPGAIFAGMFGFRDKPYFTADQAAQTAPSVNFPKF